jgi:hypothetical protein
MELDTVAITRIWAAPRVSDCPSLMVKPPTLVILPLVLPMNWSRMESPLDGPAHFGVRAAPG